MEERLSRGRLGVRDRAGHPSLIASQPLRLLHILIVWVKIFHSLTPCNFRQLSFWRWKGLGLDAVHLIVCVALDCLSKVDGSLVAHGLSAMPCGSGWPLSKPPASLCVEGKQPITTAAIGWAEQVLKCSVPSEVLLPGMAPVEPAYSRGHAHPRFCLVCLQRPVSPIFSLPSTDLIAMVKETRGSICLIRKICAVRSIQYTLGVVFGDGRGAVSYLCSNSASSQGWESD